MSDYSFDRRETGLTLTKLIYAMLVAFTTIGLFSHFCNIFGQKADSLRFIAYLDPSIAAFAFLVFCGIALGYGGPKAIFERGTVSQFSLANILLGLGAGTILAIVRILLFEKWMYFSIEGFGLTRSFSLLGILTIGLVIIGLPIAGELVFRGIVLRTLLQYASVPASLIASCGIFYFLWPLFGPLIKVLSGLTAGLMYHRTKSLVPGIIANCMLAGSGFVPLIYRLYFPIR